MQLNDKQIVEQRDFYFSLVKRLETLIDLEWAYTHKDFIIKLKTLYNEFKCPLDLDDRLKLKLYKTK